MSNKTNIEEDIKILKELNVGDDKEFEQAIENILADRERLEKENEELKEERELVGLPVKNIRSGEIGIVLHKWKSGSIAVLEKISPRVVNTHDSWKTLEIITDNTEQIKTKFDNTQTEVKPNKYDSLVEKIENKINELGISDEDIYMKYELQELLDTKKENQC